MPPRARAAAIKTTVKVVDQEGNPIDAPDDEWGSVEFNGRRIVFDEPDPAQMIVLRRLNRQLSGSASLQEKFVLVAKILDAVTALMVSEDDREFCDMEVLERRADLDAVMPLMMTALLGNRGVEKWKARQEEPPKPAKAVRRARR